MACFCFWFELSDPGANRPDGWRCPDKKQKLLKIYAENRIVKTPLTQQMQAWRNVAPLNLWCISLTGTASRALLTTPL
jgi:hypothetical protein